MARRNAKKQPEAPKVNIGAEIFESLRELEKIKGIPVDYMVERLKQALTNAYRKDREDRRDVPADNVVVSLSEVSCCLALPVYDPIHLLVPISCYQSQNLPSLLKSPVLLRAGVLSRFSHV